MICCFRPSPLLPLAAADATVPPRSCCCSRQGGGRQGKNKKSWLRTAAVAAGWLGKAHPACTTPTQAAKGNSLVDPRFGLGEN